MSFGNYVFIQIIVIAVIIAALLKKPDIEEETDVDPDIPFRPSSDEEMLFTKPTKGKTYINLMLPGFLFFIVIWDCKLYSNNFFSPNLFIKLTHYYCK